MSLVQIVGLSLIELVGDNGIKLFANSGGILNLGMGIIGYIGVFIMLIVSLQGSKLMMVNGAWDAISGLITSLFAFFILKERFESISQYIGLGLVIIGIFLLKIPLSKENPFKWPSL